VDQFLFEEKEGYCTYFATSMVVLARSIGIPARYAEGFVLPTQKEGSNFVVTNEHAHAWPELYFEGIGWISFEPTASFQSLFYNPPSQSEYEQNDYDPSLQYRQQYENQNQPQGPNNNDGGKDITEGIQIPYYVWFIPVPFLLVFFTILFQHLKRKWHFQKAMHLPSKQSILLLYVLYLKFLQYKIPILNGETPKKYAERVDRYAILYPHKFKEIGDIYVKARYTSQSLSEEEKKRVAAFYNVIKENAHYLLGHFRYYFLYLLFGF
jgi:hypothetical protein